MNERRKIAAKITTSARALAGEEQTPGMALRPGRVEVGQRTAARYAYGMGSPEENRAIGLSIGWVRLL